VVVKNIGAATWVGKSNPAARHIMMLAYHWIDGPTTRSLRANSEIADSARRRTPRVISTNTLRAHGKVIVYEGIRTPLGDDLLPGGSATINAAIQAPAQPGNFTLRLTMLEDQVVWFDERGAVPLDLLVTVTAQ
jgi:hypothetical protein